MHLLEHHMAAPIDDVVRETARIFGFLRVGHLVNMRFRKAIETLVERGIVRRNGEMIALAKKRQA